MFRTTPQRLRSRHRRSEWPWLQCRGTDDRPSMFGFVLGDRGRHGRIHRALLVRGADIIASYLSLPDQPAIDAEHIDQGDPYVLGHERIVGDPVASDDPGE